MKRESQLKRHFVEPQQWIVLVMHDRIFTVQHQQTSEIRSEVV